MSVINRLMQFSTAIRIPGLGDLTEPVCCVVQLAHQPAGVIHQVVLDPAKTKPVNGEINGRSAFLIRLGEWPGDQANGWQYTQNIAVVALLGRAVRDGNSVTVTPTENEKGVS